jgi:hypothetical protein
MARALILTTCFMMAACGSGGDFPRLADVKKPASVQKPLTASSFMAEIEAAGAVARAVGRQVQAGVLTPGVSSSK